MGHFDGLDLTMKDMTPEEAAALVEKLNKADPSKVAAAVAEVEAAIEEHKKAANTAKVALSIAHAAVKFLLA